MGRNLARAPSLFGKVFHKSIVTFCATTDTDAFLDEAALARRDDPWEALIGACGNPPVTEEGREAIVRDLASEGVLDTEPDDERTT